MSIILDPTSTDFTRAQERLALVKKQYKYNPPIRPVAQVSPNTYKYKIEKLTDPFEDEFVMFIRGHKLAGGNYAWRVDCSCRHNRRSAYCIHMAAVWPLFQEHLTRMAIKPEVEVYYSEPPLKKCGCGTRFDGPGNRCRACINEQLSQVEFDKTCLFG